MIARTHLFNNSIRLIAKNPTALKATENVMINRLMPVQLASRLLSTTPQKKKDSQFIPFNPLTPEQLNELFPARPPVKKGVFHNITRGNKPKVDPNEKFVIVKKANLRQSPLKMRFLVMLVRRKWMPDALAQLKFSPKHRAPDVAKVLRRACALMKSRYNTIPEELYVKEIFVTKGMQFKKLRYHGRGRASIARKKRSHVTIKVTTVNWPEMIKKQKDRWAVRKWVGWHRMTLKRRREYDQQQTAQAPPTAAPATQN